MNTYDAIIDHLLTYDDRTENDLRTFCKTNAADYTDNRFNTELTILMDQVVVLYFETTKSFALL